MIAMDNITVVSVFPQTGQDPFPCPVMSSCGFYSMASISRVTVNQPITTECLHPKIVPGLFGTWDTPTVDMLATAHNTPLSQFRFSISEPLVLAIGFCHKTGEAGVCFHPFPLIFNKSAETYCHNRAAGHTICRHGGSYMQRYHAAGF